MNVFGHLNSRNKPSLILKQTVEGGTTVLRMAVMLRASFIVETLITSRGNFVDVIDIKSYKGCIQFLVTQAKYELLPPCINAVCVLCNSLWFFFLYVGDSVYLLMQCQGNETN